MDRRCSSNTSFSSTLGAESFRSLANASPRTYSRSRTPPPPVSTARRTPVRSMVRKAPLEALEDRENVHPTPVAVGHGTPARLGSARRQLNRRANIITPSSSRRARIFGETVKDLLLSASRSHANVGGEQTELKAMKLNFGSRALSEASKAEADKELMQLDESRSRFGFVPRSPGVHSSPPAAIARPSPKKAPTRKVESELDDALLDIEEELLVIEKEKLENEISELLREEDLENAEGSEEEPEGDEDEEGAGPKDTMGSDRKGMLGV